MTAIRLYVDEDAMHSGLLFGLRARNVDTRTVFEAGLIGRDDRTQLAFAAREGRVLYSFNVADFCRLHAGYQGAGQVHAGIILVPRQRYGVGEQLRRLLHWIDMTSAERMVNALRFL